MTTWLVAKSGSDANGGTSQSVLSTGTDGIVSSVGGTTKITSISATWTSALVGQGIRASSGTITRLISAVQAAQSVATAITANTLTTLTSAALFNATMLGCAVSGPGIAAGTYISAYTNSSSMTLSAAAGAGAGTGSLVIGPLATTTGTTAFTSATGQTWNVGGMKATINQCLVTASGLKNVIAAGDVIYAGAGVYRETVANAVSGSQLSTTYNGSNGSSLATLGTVITLASVTGLVQPPSGYYNQGSVVTSAGVVGFTWTGISGSTLTGVTFLTNNTVTSAATVASAATLIVSIPVWVVGDVDGAQTGQAGQVVHSAFTTNDTSVPSSTALLALAATTNVSFALMTFVGGATSTVTSTAATAPGWYSFIDCTFNAMYYNGGNSILVFVSSTTGLALGVLVDRCFAWGLTTAGIRFNLATTASGSGDYDALCMIRNTQVFVIGSGFGIYVTATGTAANSPGGVRGYGNTVLAPIAFETATASHVSTTVPCEVHNSLLFGNTNAISAATSGQIVGSYNDVYASTAYVNYAAGTGDKSNSATTGTYAAPLLELGQSFKWAMGTVRPFLAPDGPSSPLLGFGNAAGSPTYDWANRPRPSGGGSASAAVGYSEFHDFGIQDTVTFPSGQTSSAKLIGPGDNDIWVPVDATSTVIAIQLNQGSGYTGTTYATATLLGNGELGVAAQVQTCSSTLNAWQTLTFSAITPSKAGWVKVRITSYDTSGTGTLNFGALT